jgi:hypothetical protein
VGCKAIDTASLLCGARIVEEVIDNRLIGFREPGGISMTMHKDRSAGQDPDHSGDVVGTFGLGGMDDKWGSQEMEENLGDQAITDAVEHLIREDETTSGLDVAIVVRDGRVYLRGRVESAGDLAKAEAVVRQAPGILDVVNELEVGAAS